MKISKLVKGLFLGIGFSLVSSISAFAGTADQGQVPSAEPPVAPEYVIAGTGSSTSGSVGNTGTTVSQDILDRQAEIDQYLFKDHSDEISKAGFKVTHTAPMDGYVEVGITPYTEENAAYIIKALGEDKIKVVEGIEAVPLKIGNGEAYATTAVPADGDMVSSDLEPLMDKTAVQNPAGSPEDEQIYTITSATEVRRDSASAPSSTLPLIGAVGAFAILAGGLFAARKMKLTRKA